MQSYKKIWVRDYNEKKIRVQDYDAPTDGGSQIEQPQDVPQPNNKRSPSANKKKLVGVALVAIILAGTGLFLYKSHVSKTDAGGAPTSHYFPSSITSADINVPVYYPVGLPPGWKVGGYKILKQNVLYYVVTTASGNQIYVTIQPLPNDFDFVGFAKKFSQPDQYYTPIGNALVGLAGANLIGSIETTTGSWIILNSSSPSQIKDMETLSRAFRQTSL